MQLAASINKNHYIYIVTRLGTSAARYNQDSQLIIDDNLSNAVNITSGVGGELRC